jgi:hypothetical protein
VDLFASLLVLNGVKFGITTFTTRPTQVVKRVRGSLVSNYAN